MIDEAFILLDKTIIKTEEESSRVAKTIGKYFGWTVVLVLVFAVVGTQMERAYEAVPGYYAPSDPAVLALALSILFVVWTASLKSDWYVTAAKWLRVSAAGFVTVWGVVVSVSSTNGAAIPVTPIIGAILLGGAYYMFFEDTVKKREALNLSGLISSAVGPKTQEENTVTRAGLQVLEDRISLLTTDLHELCAELKSDKEAEKPPESIPEQSLIASPTRCFRVLSWTIRITSGHTPCSSGSLPVRR